MRLPRLTPSAALFAVLLSASFANQAQAGPEWHVGLQPALALDTREGRVRPAFMGSLQVDLLFGREKSGEAAFGPALELGTWAFDDVRTSGLAELVLPLGSLDLGLALGPGWRFHDEGGVMVAARANLGYRAFNYSGSYGTGFGIFAGVDQPIPHDAPTWMLGVHIDGMWTALPFVFLASWIRGNPEH